MAKPWGIVPIFLLSTYLLYYLKLLAPTVNDNTDTEEVNLTFPSDLASMRSVARALQLYSSKNWFYVFLLFSAAYTYKQAFCIPGSGVLNILAGALYGTTGGLIFACIYTALGASIAFQLSKTFYREKIREWFPVKFQSYERKVEENRDRLFYFMIFIRVVPVSPGWAINLVSPLVGVPLPIFFFTTLIGLIPYNFLGVSAGGMIASLTSVNDIFTVKSFLSLLAIAGAALIPSFVLKSNKVKQ